MQKLGKLQRVDPRAVWHHEAREFTPWLRDNIKLLAEAVGLELELVEAESRVGIYAVDLYAKDLNTDHWVIIENQLEATDHCHLGQLMTYAAGKEAGVIIWISPQFHDEHRQALDWLNKVTDPAISFFGIEIELLQIDASLPAPHFKLVAQPNEWQKAGGKTVAVTTRQEAYQSFFAELLAKVKSRHPHVTTATKTYPQSWLNFPTGRSGFTVAAVFGQGNVFRVELYIDVADKDKNKAAFDTLRSEQEAIEAQLGEPVVWQRLDDKRASRIYCSQTGSIDDDPKHLAELQEWAVELIPRFQKVYKPRLQKLALDTPVAVPVAV